MDFYRSLQAAIAGLALSHTIAKAVLYGAFYRNHPLFPHAQNGQQSRHLWPWPKRAKKSLSCCLLWGAALGIGLAQEIPSPDVKFWMAALLVQSLPYVAALLMVLLSAMPRARRRARPQNFYTNPIRPAH